MTKKIKRETVVILDDKATFNVVYTENYEILVEIEQPKTCLTYITPQFITKFAEFIVANNNELNLEIISKL